MSQYTLFVNGKVNTAFVFILLAFIGCTFKAKNVLMVPRIEEPSIIKLYIDREGYLYPPEAHVTPHYFFLLHQRGAKKNQNNPEFATVEYAIRKNDSLTNAYIRQRYNLSGPDTSARFFIRLQNVLRKNIINKINESMKNQGNKNIVILIHGFNDADPDAYYFSLRRSINAHLKEQPTYIEVYWDGLTALGSNPVVAGIWQKARLNSAKVGLGLRNILKEIDHSANLTILTHSLGASVATHLLFNPNIWPRKFQEKLETDYQSFGIPTPTNKNISVGMLAPAISGTQIFNDVVNTIPEKNKVNIKNLVIGYNHFDYAVTKGGLLPKAFGNTALGADAKSEVKKTFDLLSKKERKKLRQSEHAILFYQQNINFKTFLISLFPKNLTQ